MVDESCKSIKQGIFNNVPFSELYTIRVEFVLTALVILVNLCFYEMLPGLYTELISHIRGT